MRQTLKKLTCLALALVMVLALAACGGGGGSTANVNDGTVNENTDQTEFTIMGGQSALSPGYVDNEVLNEMMDNVGIHITWDTMSESLGEKVNIAINGGDWPDAFQGVGFSNYDLMKYGSDGTFLDLTPYITPEIMPNLSKILEEQHQGRHHHDRRQDLRPALR